MKSSNFVVDGSVPSEWYVNSLLEYLQKIRSLDRHTIIMMITNFSSERLAINALRLGANDYIQKPIQDSDILPTLKRIGSKINLDDDNYWKIEKELRGEWESLKYSNQSRIYGTIRTIFPIWLFKLIFIIFLKHFFFRIFR